ncbi:MAG: uL15 family ribosomal protein [Clostridia bacterium]|nr:uL15 family ribosomal protein [Clostridia bacterium]
MKKTLNKIITVLLVLTMLMGAVSTTALAASESVSTSSESESSSTQSGGIDAGFCEISYDENGITLIVRPDVKSFLALTQAEIKEIIRTAIDAVKVAVVDKLKESIIGGLTPSAPGSSDGEEGQGRLQSLCESAITDYVNANFSGKEKNAYVAFVEALLSNANTINGFIDYAIGVVEDAVALGVVKVEDLPAAEAISVEVVLNLFETLLNNKIESEVNSCVNAYLAWIEDSTVAIDGWANSLVDKQIKSYVTSAVNAYIDAGFAPSSSDVIDVVIAEYLNGEIKNMATSWVNAYANSNDLDADVASLIDSEVNKWIEQVAVAYPNAAANPIGEYALTYINTIIDDKVNGYVNEYLATGVISDGKVDVAKIESVLLENGAGFIYESYWSNKKDGFDFSSDSFWNDIHNGLKLAAAYLGVTTEDYESTDADALRASLEARDFGVKAKEFITAEISSYTYSDWNGVWNKLTEAQQSKALALVEAAFNFQNSTVSDFILEYWSSDTRAEEHRHAAIKAIPAEKLAAAIDTVIADAKVNNKALIKSRVEAYINSSSNANVVIDTLRALLASYKTSDVAKYNEIKAELESYAINYAAGDQVFVDIFGITRDGFMDKVENVYAPAFIDAYAEALAELKKVPEVSVSYKDLIKYLDSVSIDGKYVYANSSFDVYAIKSLLTSLPFPNEIAEMTNDEMFLSYDVCIKTAFGGEASFKLTARVGGGYEKIRILARLINEHFDFYRTDDGTFTVRVRVPAKFAELAVRAIQSEKVPETLKKKVFAAFSKSPNDAYALLNSVTLDDLLEIFNYIDVEKIIDKILTIDFIQRIERLENKLENLTEEQIKNKIKEYEGYYKKLVDFVSRIYRNRFPDRFKDKTLLDLYDGEGSFSYRGTHSVDVEEILTKISEKYGPLVSSFFNVTKITASVDIAIDFENVGKVTYVVGDKVYREGFLPMGADLQYFAGISEYAGEKIVGWLGDDGVTYTTMPAKDVVLTAQFDVPEIVPPEVNVSPDVETNYDGKGVTISAEIVGGVPENVTATYQWYYIPRAAMFSFRSRPGAILIPGATESSYTVVNAYDSGDYFCEITLTDLNNNKTVVTTEPVTVIINPINPDCQEPDRNYGLVYNGQPQALIVPGTTTGGTYLYKLEGGVYSTEIPTATNAGTYTVYYMVEGDGNYNEVVERSITVVIAKADASFTAPTAKTGLVYNTLSQTLAVAGSVNVGKLLYSLDGTNYSENVPEATVAGTYTVYYKVELDSNYNAIDEGSFTVIIAKADVAFVAPTAKLGLTYTGAAQTLINAATASAGTILYSLDGTNYSENVPEATLAGMYTVYYKLELDSNYNSVDGGSFNVVIGKATPTVTAPTVNSGLIYTGAAQSLIGAGATNAGTILYKLGDGEYSADIPEATLAGRYTVYYKVVGDANYNDVAEASVTVIIGKATPTVTAPTVNSGLIYTGAAQALIGAGATNAGTILYKLGDGEYSANIPEATLAGTYTVYYKVVGDANYNDVAEASVTVIIAKAKIDPSLYTWHPESFIYDGNAKAVYLVDAEGNVLTFGVSYVGNTATNANTYVASVTVDYNNFDLVGEALFVDFTWTIEKAVYDMSGITFSDKTVSCDGLAHSIFIVGTLPDGVTVQYSENSFTEPGTYTVTATFNGDANYEPIANMSATLTIIREVVNETTFEYKDSDGNLISRVIAANGIPASYTFMFKDISAQYNFFESSEIFGKGNVGYAKGVYDIYFAEAGIQKPVEDTFTVKIALPIAAKNATGALKVVYVAENGEIADMDAKVEGDFIVFETTHFSVYAIVEVGKAPVEHKEVDLTWLWVMLVIIAVIAIAVLVFFLIKKDKDGDEPTDPTSPVVPEPQNESEAEEPATEEPAAEEPATEEPAAEEPAAEELATEEPAAEEVVVEEPAAEEPAAEELATEEPAAEEVVVEEPVTEEKPVVTPILDSKPAASFNLGEIVGVRFRTSFMSRLIQAEEELQGYYSVIKNKLLSYKGVKARTSWNFESFNKGRIQCAKLNIKGSVLQVYLALDPNEYNVNKYHFTNVGDKPKLDQVPMLLKVKSERALKYAIELIEEMMNKLGMVATTNAEVDYRMPYETTEALVARDLIKVILPAGVTLDGDESLFRINVGELLENVKGETDAPTEEPVVEEPAVEEPVVEETVVEEAPAEEPAVEEPVAEEVAVEETVAEEPAPQKPANVFASGEIIGVRYRTSFMSRLIQAEEELQGYYSVIKNKLLSYKGVKARTSWNFESFNKGRIQCAKLNIKGNALQVYLGLYPANYNANKYHFVDVSDKPKLDQVPMLLKVKSERALKYAIELIEEMMKNLEIQSLAKAQDIDYRMPYETTEALVARDLIKVILPAGVTLDGDESLVKIDVGELLENVKAEEPVAEEPTVEETAVEEAVAEEPVAEEPAVEEPAVEEPAVEETAAEEPVAEEPVVEEPVVEETVVEETVVEEAVAEEPVAEESVVEEAVAEEAVAEESVVEDPAAQEIAEEEIVHVDAVHADMIISDEAAQEKIEHLKKDASETSGGNKMAEINLDTICENFEDGDVVTISALKAKRLVNKNVGRIKVLARGVMTKRLTVCADKFSLQAVKMITLAGGHADQYK